MSEPWWRLHRVAILSPRRGLNERTEMKLSAPTHLVFLLAVILIALGLLSRLAGWPTADLVVAFWFAAVGGLLLVAGSLFKGI